MREDIKEHLDYLEFGEDADICQRISKIRNYINELVNENKRNKIRLEMLEIINFRLIRKEIFDEES